MAIVKLWGHFNCLFYASKLRQFLELVRTLHTMYCVYGIYGNNYAVFFLNHVYLCLKTATSAISVFIFLVNE